MKTKSYIIAIILYLISTSNLHAIDPEIFVQSTVNRASKILGENISKEKKMLELQNIAKDTVDITGIGFYTLGSIRKSLSEEQKNKYGNLFEKYFLKSFTSRLTDYSDPKINVLSSDVVNEKYTIVKTMLLKTDKRPEVKIDWRVYTKDPNNPLIRDLIIEGLSLARTQKEEFASVLNTNNNDINALFSTLERFIEK